LVELHQVSPQRPGSKRLDTPRDTLIPLPTGVSVFWRNHARVGEGNASGTSAHGDPRTRRSVEWAPMTRSTRLPEDETSSSSAPSRSWEAPSTPTYRTT